MLKCPKCDKKLNIVDKSYRCENGHSYDIAKKGYVNLLMSQQSSQKRHGDDKLMVRSRRDFLEKGYYSDLCDEICSVINKIKSDNDIYFLEAKLLNQLCYISDINIENLYIDLFKTNKKNYFEFLKIMVLIMKVIVQILVK